MIVDARAVPIIPWFALSGPASPDPSRRMEHRACGRAVRCARMRARVTVRASQRASVAACVRKCLCLCLPACVTGACLCLTD